MTNVNLRRLAQYVLALVIVTAATGLIAFSTRNVATLIAIYFATVALVGWYGGLGPALFATVATYLIANTYFLPPRDAFTWSSTAFAYLFVCLTIAAFSEISRRSRQRADADSRQLKMIVESIADGFVVVDRTWHVTYMNQATEEFHRHYIRTDKIRTDDGSAARGVFPLVLGESAMNRFREAVRDQKTVEFEHYYPAWRQWFELRASPTAAGGLTIYFRDITERKRNEEETRRLASIIESSEDAVIGVDLAGKITSWNQAAEALYGYSADEVIGHEVLKLLPRDNLTEESAIVARIRRGEQVRHYDTIRVHKDGRLVDISLSISVMRDANGEIVGYAKIARDVGDRKRAEEALREADRRKDDFLALLGHELRNPLAGIVHGIEILNQQEVADADTREVQGVIQRQARHMSRLIDDLLDVSRIVRGKITLELESIDLVALARQTALDHRGLVEQAGLSLRLDPAAGPVWVAGDRIRLAQVLSNLLNNAIKFTDAGGRVSIIIRKDDSSQRAELEVRDTGIGMTPGTIAGLFEPFAQAHDARGRSEGGLGLGLAVVKGLVELHHGAIQATSGGPRFGSAFLVRLPLTETPADQSPPRTEDASETPPKRVLVVDDNRDVLHLMTKLLERSGHTVAVAKDGPSGIETAQKFHPDLVLCDIGLPGEVNGYKVAQALRADPTTRAAHLVAITGYGQEEDRRRAVEAGFDRHLTKPVGYTDLMSLIAGLRPRQDRAPQ